MNKHHGKVIDIQDENLIVMSDTGAFHRIKKFGNEKIGQTLLYTDYEREEEPVKNDGPMPISGYLGDFFKRRGVWALVPVMIFLLVFLVVPSNEPAYALVTMDINPSIGYYIDAEQVVMRTKAYNEDGQKVLSEMEDLKGQNISDAMSQTVEMAKELSYLSEEKNEILITGAILAKEKETTEEDDFKVILDQVASQVDEKASLDVTVYEVESTPESLQASENNGLSLGKTVLSEELQVSEDVVKGKSISEMAKDISEIAKVKVYGQSKKEESDKDQNQDKAKNQEETLDQDSEQDRIEDQSQERLEDQLQDKAQDKADKLQDKADKTEDKVDKKEDKIQDKTDKVKDKANKAEDKVDNQSQGSDGQTVESEEVDKEADKQSDKNDNISDKDKSSDKAKEEPSSNGKPDKSQSSTDKSNANNSNADKNKDK